MNTRHHFSIKVILGAALLVFSQIAWSLGLGEAKVETFLGQPLEVRIELITRPTDDLASVNAGLASAADYQLIGASRDDVSVPLQFSVEDLDGGAFDPRSELVQWPHAAGIHLVPGSPDFQSARTSAPH